MVDPKVKIHEYIQDGRLWSSTIVELLMEREEEVFRGVAFLLVTNIRPQSVSLTPGLNVGD